MAIDNAMRAILEAAREYGFYVYRGDPAVFDYKEPDWTMDYLWHELDLSAIVPANAKAIDASFIIAARSTGKFFHFRRHGQVNNKNICFGMINVAWGSYGFDLTIPCDADRKIDYLMSPDIDLVANFIVKGWWY